jgi:6-phosphofructokinase 1
VRYFHEHQERLGFDLRATTLGHVQRGGAPGVFDRLLATRLGSAATEALEAGHHGVLMGLHGNTIGPTPLEEVVTCTKPLDTALIELAQVLAR